MIKLRINTWVVSIGIVALLLGVVAFIGYNLYAPKTGYVGYTPPQDLNVFTGKITNAKVAPGRIEGTSAYDRNCIGDSVTECDGGILTKEYGLVNFHYFHEMAVQPCIHMFGSEKMIVEVLDSDGNAKVTRTQDFGSMAGHHG
ncbi:MAG: hypothetical protein HYW23_02510 [Candidatus Aenigmarchaeota archaeon]|nr:hypothetical protein [Candidatus Aenigmarchaeota archaeon]